MNYIRVSIRVSNADAIDFVIADLQDKPVESIEVIGLAVVAYVPKDQYQVIKTDDFLKKSLKLTMSFFFIDLIK